MEKLEGAWVIETGSGQQEHWAHWAQAVVLRHWARHRPQIPGIPTDVVSNPRPRYLLLRWEMKAGVWGMYGDWDAEWMWLCLGQSR